MLIRLEEVSAPVESLAVGVIFPISQAGKLQLREAESLAQGLRVLKGQSQGVGWQA